MAVALLLAPILVLPGLDPVDPLPQLLQLGMNRGFALLDLSAHEMIGHPLFLQSKHTLIEATVEGLPTGLGLFPEPIRERRCVLVARACRRCPAPEGC